MSDPADPAVRPPSPQPAGQPPATAAVTVRQPGVLLVDDDPFSLDLQRQTLQAIGYDQVRTAEGGEQALALLLADPAAIDVVVCDVNMPGMDGIEFLQKLDSSGFDGGVILLSGEGVRILHTVRKLLDGGRLDLLGALTKPASRHSLAGLLELWMPDGGAPTRPPPPVIDADEVRTANRLGQWVLHYQPQVDLVSGDVIGVEALVRWNHPQHGLVFPDGFIHVAEECGAIDALTDWVLQAAMAQLAAWQADGLDLRMAVNLSMDNLLQPDFARRVGAMAREAGVRPEHVTLEITESRVISGQPAPLENLVRLRLQRFALSIDDFGTGHSSLAQLRDVPFSELKVDRGFVQGARHNQIIRPILEASISVARGLAMQTLAEGIETLEDWELLRQLACDFGQGYFIGRPGPAAQVPAWMEAWAARRPALVAEPMPGAAGAVAGP
ncbi:EAL domain-containing protein [Xylophilus sp. Kf1]|nr:EAL domain-containing protein [Xylophilus sp. Kf1]